MDGRSTSVPATRRAAILVATLAGLAIAGLAIFLATAETDGGLGASAPNPTASASDPGSAAEPTMTSEALPPSSEEDPALPLVSDPEASLVTTPFPDSASASGALVAGFPVRVIGPLAGADVVESAIVSGPESMRTTLVARTDSSGAEVVAQYRALWGSLGLWEEGSLGTGDVAYAGPHETVTLAIQPSAGTGTIYVISAVFRTS